MHASYQHVKSAHLQLRLILHHSFLANDRAEVIDVCGSELTSGSQVKVATVHTSSVE